MKSISNADENSKACLVIHVPNQIIFYFNKHSCSMLNKGIPFCKKYFVM